MIWGINFFRHVGLDFTVQKAASLLQSVKHKEVTFFAPAASTVLAIPPPPPQQQNSGGGSFRAVRQRYRAHADRKLQMAQQVREVLDA
jgi:hypothetical protein